MKIQSQFFGGIGEINFHFIVYNKKTFLAGRELFLSLNLNII
jgi:hypothetical protein